MSVVPLKPCAVPGCDQEFPEHYLMQVCGNHTPEEMVDHGGYFEWTDTSVVAWLENWMEERVYWEDTPRAAARRFNLPYTAEDLEKIKKVPWVLKASVGNHTLRIYFERSDEDQARRWGFSLEPEFGTHPESEITWGGFSRAVAQWKAIQAASLTCSSCQKDVTFDWRITSFRSTDEGTVMGDSTCKLCDTKERVETFRDAGVLNTTLNTTAILEVHAVDKYGEESKYPDFMDDFRAVTASLERIADKIKQFEREVWFDGLQAKVQNNTHSGESVTLSSGVEVRSLAMCGRWRATLQHPEGFHIDIICAEDSEESSMGLNYINCTEFQALALLDDALSAWKSGELNFEQADVGIGV